MTYKNEYLYMANNAYLSFVGWPFIFIVACYFKSEFILLGSMVYFMIVSITFTALIVLHTIKAKEPT